MNMRGFCISISISITNDINRIAITRKAAVRFYKIGRGYFYMGGLFFINILQQVLVQLQYLHYVFQHIDHTDYTGIPV